MAFDGNRRKLLLLTYLRFACSDQSRLEQLGSDLNTLVPGFFRGLSLDAQMTYWFSEVVADSDDWDEHLRKLEALLGNGGDVLLQAVRDGVSIEVRSVVAYGEAPEHKGRRRTRFDMPAMLLRRLTELRAPFLFRIDEV